MLPQADPAERITRLRPQRAIEEQLWRLIITLPDLSDDHEDSICGQLQGLLFALGIEWDAAYQIAATLWNARVIQSRPLLCPTCGGTRIKRDDDHEPPGDYYHCRTCGERWVEYAGNAADAIIAELEQALGR